MDGRDLLRPRGDRTLKERIGIVDSQDDANWARTARFRAAVDVFLHPERRAADLEPGDSDSPVVTIEAVRLDRTECLLVILDGPRAIAHRQPRCDARLERRIAHRHGLPNPSSATFSTAAPVRCPCERSMSALSASSSGYGLVVTSMPMRAAIARNSSPSTLVFAVTERRRFS